MQPGDETRWELTLYVNGAGPRSSAAIEIVRRICDTELAGRYVLSVYDASEHPEAALRDNILALPTLVKHSPSPRRYVVGDLADVERLRAALDLGVPLPRSSGASTADGVA